MPRLAHLALATTAAALRPVTRRNLGPAGLGLATGLAYREHAAAADFAKTGSGLQYLDIKEGTGATPEPGQTVQVHYNGWLDDFGDAPVPSLFAVSLSTSHAKSCSLAPPSPSLAPPSPSRRWSSPCRFA